METIKFSAARFSKNGKPAVRFALHGNLLKAGLKELATEAGFALTEDLANTYYAWATTPEEIIKIQNAIKPLVVAGKVST